MLALVQAHVRTKGTALGACARKKEELSAHQFARYPSYTDHVGS